MLCLGQLSLQLRESQQKKSVFVTRSESCQAVVSDLKSRLEDLLRANVDLSEARDKTSSENRDLCGALEEFEVKTSQLSQAKIALSRQLGEVQRVADEEARDKAELAVKIRAYKDENDTLKVSFEALLIVN